MVTFSFIAAPQPRSFFIEQPTKSATFGKAATIQELCDGYGWLKKSVFELKWTFKFLRRMQGGIFE
jgi:hypothetical protein